MATAKKASAKKVAAKKAPAKKSGEASSSKEGREEVSRGTCCRDVLNLPNSRHSVPSRIFMPILLLASRPTLPAKNGRPQTLMEQSSVAVSASHDHQIQPPFPARFGLGDRVRKKSGAARQGRIVGWYSTQLTAEGYAVESEAHPGSVQIYPVAALERVA
jgi:dihydrofolate reductase (trimethoprim resistance protein)